MNRPYLVLVIVLAVLAIGAVAYATYDFVRQEPTLLTATSTPDILQPQERAYGEVTLMLGETAVFPDVRVTPLAVVEDSRCPMNARCIQAGTVRVQVEIVSGMGTSTNTVELGKSITTEAEEISLVGVSPETLAGEEIGASEYRLTFEVGKRGVAPSTQGKCYVGGCSMQLCTDTPDMASTCEYREAYACYKGATCERQASGACGWTETAALRACLLNAQ
jgi:hypothetical protein